MNDDDIINIASREIASLRAFFGPDATAQSALLPVLHAIQTAYGYVDAATLPVIAHELNISQAEVRGVLSFYHDFRLEPPGRHVLKLCRAEACQSMGGEAVAQRAQSRHGLRPGATTPDGALTVENVYCLGNCACAPAAMLDGELIGRMDETRLDAIIAETRTGARA